MAPTSFLNKPLGKIILKFKLFNLFVKYNFQFNIHIDDGVRAGYIDGKGKMGDILISFGGDDGTEHFTLGFSTYGCFTVYLRDIEDIGDKGFVFTGWKDGGFTKIIVTGNLGCHETGSN